MGGGGADKKMNSVVVKKFSFHLLSLVVLPWCCGCKLARVDLSTRRPISLPSFIIFLRDLPSRFSFCLPPSLFIFLVFGY